MNDLLYKKKLHYRLKIQRKTAASIKMEKNELCIFTRMLIKAEDNFLSLISSNNVCNYLGNPRLNWVLNERI